VEVEAFVAIVTENLNTTMMKIQNFIHYKSNNRAINDPATRWKPPRA